MIHSQDSVTATPAPDFIGRCKAGHVVLSSEQIVGGWIQCPCGRPAIAKGFRATYSDKKCDGRCTAAVGPSCSCECGGHNHGSSRRFGA